ncbi:MAG: hypothetical protein ACOVKO_05445 [Elstera sp.]
MVVPRLTIKIQGHYYETLDWSYGGLRLKLPTTAPVPTTPLLGLIIGPNDDIGVFSGGVARIDKVGEALSVTFAEVSEEGYDLLDRLVREKLIAPQL